MTEGNHLIHQHIPSDLTRHAIQCKLAEPEPSSSQSAFSALLILPGVTHSVDDPINKPPNTQQGAGGRVSQTRDHQRSQERSLILEEVAVSALGAVEDVGLLALIVGGRVGLRVGDTGLLADWADTHAMPC